MTKQELEDRVLNVVLSNSPAWIIDFVHEMEAEISRLRAGLEWFAELKNYDACDCEHCQGETTIVECVGFQKARDLLEGSQP